MNIIIPPGKYIAAVSGGVDSMVLMNLLKEQDGVEIVIGHLNHGIRKDSYLDERFVSAASRNNFFAFESKKIKLGRNASEETARKARYEFLESLRIKYNADRIITAHHQDDVIESAIMNLLRGTGPAGLVSMSRNKAIFRPLLNTPKSAIVDYAKNNGIKWREDGSNEDEKYLRNYVRRHLAPKISLENRRKILKSIDTISIVAEESRPIIDALSSDVKPKNVIDRGKFINLSNQICNELLATWLRDMGIRDFDKAAIQRLSMAIKTAKPGTKHDVIHGLRLLVNKKTAILQPNR